MRPSRATDARSSRLSPPGGQFMRRSDGAPKRRRSRPNRLPGAQELLLAQLARVAVSQHVSCRGDFSGEDGGSDRCCVGRDERWRCDCQRGCPVQDLAWSRGFSFGPLRPSNSELLIRRGRHHRDRDLLVSALDGIDQVPTIARCRRALGSHWGRGELPISRITLRPRSDWDGRVGRLGHHSHTRSGDVDCPAS